MGAVHIMTVRPAMHLVKVHVAPRGWSRQGVHSNLCMHDDMLGMHRVSCCARLCLLRPFIYSIPAILTPISVSVYDTKRIKREFESIEVV